MSIEEALARAIAGQYRMRSWEIIGECDKAEYRAVAAGVIKELGLTEQWGLKSGNNPPNTMKSEALAKDRAQRWPESFTAVYRYTTPWENAR